LVLTLAGCIGYEEIETRLPMCKNPSELNCKEVSKCLDDCSNEPIIPWAMDCRGKYESYVISKC